MKKKVLGVLLLAGILAGCGRPTTGAEIDRIMAEARAKAAEDLARSRGGWGIPSRVPEEDGVITTASTEPQ